MKQRFFITATGTDIGKSFITAALARQAKALGRSVMAYKPILSGFDPSHPETSDTAFLLRSLDLPLTAENIKRVSPWRFKAPLAPSMAVRMEGRKIDFDALLQHGHTVLSGHEDTILIEGVGGVMVPLNNDHTVLDWMALLNAPVILVTGSYLGALSHTLTALVALRQKNVRVHGIVVNESENPTVSLPDSVDELAHWTDFPIYAVKRHQNSDWNSSEEVKTLLMRSD